MSEQPASQGVRFVFLTRKRGKVMNSLLTVRPVRGVRGVSLPWRNNTPRDLACSLWLPFPPGASGADGGAGTSGDGRLACRGVRVLPSLF